MNTILYYLLWSIWFNRIQTFWIISKIAESEEQRKNESFLPVRNGSNVFLVVFNGSLLEYVAPNSSSRLI